MTQGLPCRFTTEVIENVLDGTPENAEAFALLGFGGKQIMKLRNLQSPEVLEETMDKEKILIQQHAKSIKNDYSQHVQKGFIGNNEGTVNFNDAEPKQADPKQQEEAPKEAPQKARASGANPPNKEVKKRLIRFLRGWARPAECLKPIRPISV